MPLRLTTILMASTTSARLRSTAKRIFFKIDYFDPMRAMHSEDPADASVTERMMTIMLASEY